VIAIARFSLPRHSWIEEPIHPNDDVTTANHQTIRFRPRCTSLRSRQSRNVLFPAWAFSADVLDANRGTIEMLSWWEDASSGRDAADSWPDDLSWVRRLDQGTRGHPPIAPRSVQPGDRRYGGRHRAQRYSRFGEVAARRIRGGDREAGLFRLPTSLAALSAHDGMVEREAMLPRLRGRS